MRKDIRKQSNITTVRDGLTYYGKSLAVTLSADDDPAGVKQIYSAGADGTYAPYHGFDTRTEGNYRFRYYALDEMDNAQSDDYIHNTGIVYVDLTGLKLSYELSGASFRKGDVLFVSPECKIVFKAVDGESGLQYITYTIDGQTGETSYTAPFPVRESGVHTIRYFGYDNVNNRNSAEMEITVDGEDPEIFSTFSIKRIDSDTANTDTTGAGVFPSYVILYPAATDLLTGNAEIYYSINGAPELSYTAPIGKFAKNRSYTFVIRAKDKLGNVSEKTVRFSTGDY